MMKTRKPLAISALFSFCIYCAVAQHPQDVPQKFEANPILKSVGTSKEKISAMDSLLQSFVRDQKVSSVVGFVAKGGNIVYKKAFGWKDVENRVQASPEDYYILFSQTKAITSVAFMTLVEKGLVAVNEPVSKYFPEISDKVVTGLNTDGSFQTRTASKPMTFAHLLSHTSGLGAGFAGKIRRSDLQKADSVRKVSGSGQTNGPRYLKDDMLALAKYPLGFDPGSDWNYHVSTNMLAYMIERISGKPLREYIKETILIPLGMNDTDWYYAPEALGRFVKAYNAIDGKLVPVSNQFSEKTISKSQTYAEGALGLNGPIEDYAKFCQMLLNKGIFNGRRILQPETIAQMTTINRLPEKNAGGKGFKFGLGFELYNDQKKPAPQVSNTAFAWGGIYGTEYIVDPENSLIALFYLNMPKHESLSPKFIRKAYQLFR